MLNWKAVPLATQPPYIWGAMRIPTLMGRELGRHSSRTTSAYVGNYRLQAGVDVAFRA